ARAARAPAARGRVTAALRGVFEPVERAPAPEGRPDLGAGPRLERRKLDWGNLAFLERLVRRGIPVDGDWKETWEKACEEKGAPADFAAPPPPDVLKEFVEQNLCQLVNKPWAKEEAEPPRRETSPPPRAEPACDGAAAPAA
ncbi:unnamed protein product, partial [Prorocentrum cordatum]